MGATIQWNAFSVYDWGDYMEGGDGRSFQCFSLGMTAEGGFIISNGLEYNRTLTFTGGYSNAGNNSTFWARAFADTLIDYEWMLSIETPLKMLDMGVGTEYFEGGAITLYNNQSAYIAVLGHDFEHPARWLTGWIQIKNNQGEIEILSSAFADAALYVGTGDASGFAGPGPGPIPEPASGLFALLGVAALGLKRNTVLKAVGRGVLPSQ